MQIISRYNACFVRRVFCGPLNRFIIYVYLSLCILYWVWFGGIYIFFIFQVRSDHASFCVIAQQVNFNIEEYLINIFLFYYFLCGVCALWKLSHRLCCRADCALVRARYCLSTIGDIAASWYCILLCIEWRCRKVERVWDIVIHIIILYRYFK